jgi:protein ImuB
VVGERRAGIARLLDSYRRDGFQVDRFTNEATDKVAPTPTSDSRELKLAMRLIRPSCQIQVHMCEGRPFFLATGAGQITLNLAGEIVWLSGPWRSSGDWWTENSNGKDPSGAWDREEWDIALAIANKGNQTANGEGQKLALYRIYHDVGSGQWFADASYD